MTKQGLQGGFDFKEAQLANMLFCKDWHFHFNHRVVSLLIAVLFPLEKSQLEFVAPGGVGILIKYLYPNIVNTIQANRGGLGKDAAI